MEPTRERRVKELAREVGFDLARIADAEPLRPERDRYLEWIEAGRAAEMGWITRERAEASAEPRRVLAEARSVICLGLAYGGTPRRTNDPTAGWVARYAWGRDYHLELGERLDHLAVLLRHEFGGEHRWYVDTGPLMDKALAVRAGLGWYGKNTNVLTESFGSYVLLGEIVTTLPLTPDLPLARSCGSCRVCAVACPTGAIGPHYSLDAGKCISYLTIEHRRAIPRELRGRMGAWVLGCDICQDVCPPTVQPYVQTREDRNSWTSMVRHEIRGARGDKDSTNGAAHDPATSNQPGPRPAAPADAPASIAPPHFPLENGRLDLLWLLCLSHEEYVEVFRGTAIRRAKVWMLRRNAAVALGNVGDGRAVGPLIEAMGGDPHPVVRGHAAWALGRLATRLRDPSITPALEAACEREADDGVREEIEAALQSAREAVR